MTKKVESVGNCSLGRKEGQEEGKREGRKKEWRERGKKGVLSAISAGSKHL